MLSENSLGEWQWQWRDGANTTALGYTVSHVHSKRISIYCMYKANATQQTPKARRAINWDCAGCEKKTSEKFFAAKLAVRRGFWWNLPNTGTVCAKPQNRFSELVLELTRQPVRYWGIAFVDALFTHWYKWLGQSLTDRPEISASVPCSPETWTCSDSVWFQWQLKRVANDQRPPAQDFAQRYDFHRNGSPFGTYAFSNNQSNGWPIRAYRVNTHKWFQYKRF